MVTQFCQQNQTHSNKAIPPNNATLPETVRTYYIQTITPTSFIMGDQEYIFLGASEY